MSSTTQQFATNKAKQLPSTWKSAGRTTLLVVVVLLTGAAGTGCFYPGPGTKIVVVPQHHHCECACDQRRKTGYPDGQECYYHTHPSRAYQEYRTDGGSNRFCEDKYNYGWKRTTP